MNRKASYHDCTLIPITAELVHLLRLDSIHLTLSSNDLAV